MIRVVVAEDHGIVRQGLCALLERADDIEVVGQAGDGHQAVELARKLVPDVLLMDISMPRMDGTRATRRVAALDQDTAVVILSMHADETLVRQTLRQGARGYLLKECLDEELQLAVRAASRGETYLSPAVSDEVLADLLEADPESPFERLTPREREVLQLIVEGYTNKEMAELMHISVKTVEKHRASLMSTLDVHNVAALTRTALKHNLVFPNTT